MSQFKPMLASGDYDPALVTFPCWLSPKVDGVRGLVRNGKLTSRKLLDFPNSYAMGWFSQPFLEGLDGELVLSSIPPFDPEAFRLTNSSLARQDGQPVLTFYVFDLCHRPLLTYTQRLSELNGRIKLLSSQWNVQAMPQHYVKDMGELESWEKHYVDLGYEGVIIRNLTHKYKFGRSTMREMGMVKVKRFADSECRILEVHEQMHNANAAQKDALGHTKRSKHKENMIGVGTAGAVTVQDIHTGVVFNIGVGDAIQAECFWNDREKIKEVKPVWKYKFQKVGVKDKPRFPILLGPRHDFDLS